MSISIMNRVWEKSTQKGSALLLTIALADNANHDGICYPGIDYLKKKIRMSERATERLLDTLVDAGEIYRKVGRGRGQRTQYAILTTLDKDSIVNLLQKYAEQFSLSNGDAEKHADEIIEKRRQYDTLKSERKQRRSETSKSVKKTSNSSKKGVVTERKTPTTVEPSSSNTNTDSNSSELESCAPASQDAPPKSETENSAPVIQEKELETPPSSAAPPNPLPPLAPPGFRWLCSSVSDSSMHLIPSASNDRSARALCKANVPHRVAWSPLTDRPPCAECVRIANEPPKPINETWSTEVKNEFADLCKMSWSIPSNTTMMIKYLRDINYSEPVTVEKLRKFKANWYKCDFRGKQGSAPKARWISEHWREYTESDDCKESSNGTADAQQAFSGSNGATAASDNGRESGLLADGKKLTQNQRFALLSAQQAERERRGR